MVEWTSVGSPAAWRAADCRCIAQIVSICASNPVNFGCRRFLMPPVQEAEPRVLPQCTQMDPILFRPFDIQVYLIYGEGFQFVYQIIFMLLYSHPEHNRHKHSSFAFPFEKRKSDAIYCISGALISPSFQSVKTEGEDLFFSQILKKSTQDTININHKSFDFSALQIFSPFLITEQIYC